MSWQEIVLIAEVVAAGGLAVAWIVVCVLWWRAYRRQDAYLRDR